MAIQTRVYGNGGTGGPVNYASPIATVSGSTYTPSALATGSDWTFAVRSYDTVTGLEERNIDGTYRIVVGSTGADTTAVPMAPLGLTVTPTTGGNLSVSWFSMPSRTTPVPTGFHVYAASPTLTLPGPSPVATAPYIGPRLYTATVTGFTSGSTVQIVVRAYNAAGEDGNTTTVSAVPISATPTTPDPISYGGGGGGLGGTTGDTGTSG